jgi:hypothetical protein
MLAVTQKENDTYYVTVYEDGTYVVGDYVRYCSHDGEPSYWKVEHEKFFFKHLKKEERWIELNNDNAGVLIKRAIQEIIDRITERCLFGDDLC